MPSHRRRIHRSRRSRRPIIIVGLLVAVIAVTIIVVYNLNPSEYTLTIYTVGQGSVTPGNGTYPAGTVLELKAASASNCKLYSWSGDAAASSNTSIIMNGTKVVTAVFIPNNNKVLFMTSMGNMTIKLRDDMPITAGNFKNLVQQGKYDGTVFHRVIADFMIQGGQINSTWANITDEFGSNNHNVRGTIAMAKTSQANSATSQFFINVVDNSNRTATFDSTYSVFGDVISGMDVVDSISKVTVVENSMTGELSTPAEDILLNKAEFID